MGDLVDAAGDLVDAAGDLVGDGGGRTVGLVGDARRLEEEVRLGDLLLVPLGDTVKMYSISSLPFV